LDVGHKDVSFVRRLAQLAKLDLLILDDFALTPIVANERRELLDDWVGSRVTLITGQCLACLAEPAIPDLLHLRKHRAGLAQASDEMRVHKNWQRPPETWLKHVIPWPSRTSHWIDIFTQDTFAG
jgi:hypothetical protein